MTTYAVFGMTRTYALAEARRRVSPVVGNQVIPENEWIQRVEERAAATMAGTTVKMVSQAFDAPQFCDEFIALARRSGECRGLHIRAKQPLLTEAGRPVLDPRTHKPKKAWLPWSVTA
jgi:hypothetical protein